MIAIGIMFKFSLLNGAGALLLGVGTIILSIIGLIPIYKFFISTDKKFYKSVLIRVF